MSDIDKIQANGGKTVANGRSEKPANGRGVVATQGAPEAPLNGNGIAHANGQGRGYENGHGEKNGHAETYRANGNGHDRARVYDANGNVEVNGHVEANGRTKVYDTNGHAETAEISERLQMEASDSESEKPADWEETAGTDSETQSAMEARIARIHARAARVAALSQARVNSRESIAKAQTVEEPLETDDEVDESGEPIPQTAEAPATTVIRRRMPKKWTFLFWVVLPTVVSAIYFYNYSTKQYISTASFSIESIQRSSGSKSGGGGLSSLFGAGPETIAQEYIVQQYVASPQILKDLQPLIDLRKIYSKPEIDFFSRLRDPHSSEEDLLAYWNSMVTVNYDVMMGLSTLQVRAFSPEDSKDVADKVLQLSEALVNRLSERALNDSVRLAKSEVDLAYKRAGAARDAMEAYSQTSQQVSPEAYVKSHAVIQATLESQLVTSQAQLDVLRKSLPEDAPGVKQIKDTIAVIQNQLASEKQYSTDTTAPASPTHVATGYGKLQMESEFATQAYVSALSTLETAQLQAISQSAYLEPFVRPQLPTISAYPNRPECVVLTFLVSFLIWAIGSFIVAAIRDH